MAEPRHAVALVCAVMLAGMAACAPPGGDPGASPGMPSGPVASSKGLTGGKDLVNRYLDCLRAHGVPMPSTLPSHAAEVSGAPHPTGPQFPGGAPSKPAGVGDDVWVRAKTACTGIVPGL